MSEKVAAQVILRRRNGTSIVDAEGAITADTIAKYQVEKEVIEQASSTLAEMGFAIEQTGPTSLAISGDRVLFEATFRTTLEAKRTEILPGKVVGVETTYFEAKEPIIVPEDLASLIADVVLPIPPQFYP